MTAASPSAAATDQVSEPVTTPSASPRPVRRPACIAVSAIASVAGPGLALATKAAERIRGRLIERDIVSARL